MFSVTLADIDLASFCAVTFIDFETGQRWEATEVRRSGFPALPDAVDGSIAWSGQRMSYACDYEANDDMAVDFACPNVGGVAVRAQFVTRRPPHHESLNVVVPWTSSHFQFNSKHNTLPCQGSLTIGDRRIDLRPELCHGVHDFGRGIWPYRSWWNWAVCTGISEGDLVGVNMGGKWTTATGSNENGVFLSGRLYKVMEDLEWSYDPARWMQPWRVCAPRSAMIDLTLTPRRVYTTGMNLGVLASGGTVAFGTWAGIVRAGGREVRIEGLVGWAEEFAHRW